MPLLHFANLIKLSFPHPGEKINSPALNGEEGEGCGSFCSLKLPLLRDDASTILPLIVAQDKNIGRHKPIGFLNQQQVQ